MTNIAYKQLHLISTSEWKSSSDRCLPLSSCVHDYIVCRTLSGIAFYNVKRYFRESDTCQLRRDKCLPDFKPDVLIKSSDPVQWLSFNSDQLTLAVITCNSSLGCRAHLLDVRKLSEYNNVDLSAISRVVPLCGVELSNGSSGWQLRDFGWNPAITNMFVVILRTGSVKLFDASPEQPHKLIDEWPASVDARCLSWSARGKQLALCVLGKLNTSSGPIQGPAIIQTDGQLRFKRIIQLADSVRSIVGDHPWEPLDLLWLTPVCFVLGLQYVGKSELRALVIHAPAKSPAIQCVELIEMQGRREPHHTLHYFFQPVGPTHFWANCSAGGEELILYSLSLPSESGPYSATNLLSIELPPDGFPVGTYLGHHRKRPESKRFSAYITVLLSSGKLCVYLLHKLDELSPPFFALPEPVPLKVAPPPNPPEPTTQTQQMFGKPQDSNPLQGAPTPSLPLSTPDLLGTPLIRPTSPVQPPKPPQPQPVLKVTPISQPSIPSPTPLQEPRAVVSTEAKTSSPTIPLPNSVRKASDEFSNLIQSELAAGKTAWQELFNLLKTGGPTDATDRPDKYTGVDVIEARLMDMNLFLSVTDKVMQELSLSVSDRKDDLIESTAYADHLRRLLEVCSAGDWVSPVTEQLDPESARLLSKLKRRARSVESTLFELDTQLDALLAETEGFVKTSSKKPSRDSLDRSPSMEKVSSTLETISRLIRREQGRISFLTDAFRRMRLMESGDQSTTDRQGVSLSEDLTWRPTVNADYRALVQRDRALYRWFAHHKPSVVRAQSLCPPTDDSLIATLMEKENVPQEEEPKLPTQHPPVQHPQQILLEQLLDRSSKVASVHSPPVKSPLTKSLESKPTPSSVDKSSMPRIHMGRPIESTMAATPSTPTTVKSTTTPSAKPTANGFVLGAKTASPISPALLPTTRAPVAGITVPSVSPAPLSTTATDSTPKAPSLVASPTTVPSASVGQTPTVPPLGTGSLFGTSVVSSLTPASTATTAPPSSTTTFSFGSSFTPQSTSPSFGGLAFGTAKTTVAATVSPSPATAASTLFGTPTTTTSVPSGVTQSLFGSITPASTTTNGLFGGLFGTQPKTTSPLVTATSAASPPPLFGTTATSTSAPTAQSPFGSLTPASSATNTGLFGSLFGTQTKVTGPSVTATNATSTPSLFGTTASTPSGQSLFGLGSLSTTSSATTTATLGGLFGALATSPAVPTTTATSKATPSLFGSTTASSPGLFGSVAVSSPPASTAAGGLFGTLAGPTSPGSSGGLFGSLTSSTSGGLFGVTTTPTPSGLGTNLFQSPPTTGTGLFGSGGSSLFGKGTTTSTSSGLFSFSAAAGSQATTTAPSGGGLFGSSAQQNTGLFGTVTPSTGTQSTDVQSLFAGSNFGLGAPASTTSTTNVFGKPGLFGTSATQGPTPSLFGVAPTSTNAQPKSTDLFGSAVLSSPQSTGLFGSSVSAPSGGSFGTTNLPSSPQTQGGFGSRPVFGDTPFAGSPGGGQQPNVFGGKAVFGTSGGLFGAPTATPGTSLFGSTAPSTAASSGAGGLFAALAAQSSGPSFGSLATGQPAAAPAAPSSPFGPSPSFTQRRA